MEYLHFAPLFSPIYVSVGMKIRRRECRSRDSTDCRDTLYFVNAQANSNLDTLGTHQVIASRQTS